MAQPYVTPAEVDEVRVTTIVDNSIDVLMASTEVAERYLMGPNGYRSWPVERTRSSLSQPSLSMAFQR